MSGQRPADFGRALVRFPRPNPFVVGWRWRYEAGVAVGFYEVHDSALWTVLCGLMVAGAAAVPYGRRRVWCVVTPHRVRTGLKHAWVHSRTGRLPMVLWTRPVPAGRRCCSSSARVPVSATWRRPISPPPAGPGTSGSDPVPGPAWPG